MRVADPPMLDQRLVEQAPRGLEVELIEGTRASAVDGARCVDHAPCVPTQTGALQVEGPRAGNLAPQPSAATELHQRERFLPGASTRVASSLVK